MDAENVVNFDINEKEGTCNKVRDKFSSRVIDYVGAGGAWYLEGWLEDGL